MTRGWRQLRMGMATVLGLDRRGFFIPYRYAGAVPGPGERLPYAALGDLFAGRKAVFLDLLAGMDRLAPDLERISSGPPPEPRWNQDWFPRLDAAAAYAMVRDRAPGRIVEVGSGHSTRFYARAVRDGDLSTDITAIDPAPRADIERTGVKVVRSTVQEAGLEPFRDLGAGDVLSIDSSHVLMPGTDVDFLLNVILPTLPAGVLVHIHDVFLPDDYPPSWDWRGYNEQQGVAALIQGAGFQILWSSHYMTTRHADALADTVLARIALVEGALESSLWLEKGAGRSD